VLTLGQGKKLQRKQERKALADSLVASEFVSLFATEDPSASRRLFLCHLILGLCGNYNSGATSLVHVSSLFTARTHARSLKDAC
jgi:hypothetical protein